MAKTTSQIRDEIANFYLSIQDEVTDVSTGSVAGGLIYAFAAALQSLYSDLDDLESQAYIATATGRYLDLLIEGGFFLSRPEATRSVGYVVVYGDNPLVNPELTGSRLICAEYDEATGEFTSGLSAATKFTGVNASGSGNVTYALIRPKNSAGYKVDAQGRFIIDLKNKQAKYLILPVASVLSGSQTNVLEGALNTFTNPPDGLKYVLNTNTPAEVIFSSPGISSAPLYSRTTSMNLLSESGVFSVVNAFNFSSSGFLEISYKSFSPTNLLSAVYKNEFDEEISAGLVFEYDTKTQTSISLKSSEAYVKNFVNNELTTFELINFTYNNVIFSVDSSDVWTANSLITLDDGSSIGPSNPIYGSAEFFKSFFHTTPWVLRQRAEQISDDIIFDPDSALFPETYVIRESFRLSTARDSFDDEQYRRLFRSYLTSLPRATSSALEFGASQVSGISFAKTLPANQSPVGTAVLLAADENGVLSLSQKQSVINYLKDDWVAAGINLLVRAPDLINFSMAVNVKLTTPNLESFVRSSIRDSVENYLASLNPGDEIKYGDIYSIISSITGVKNVSKLIVGKNEPAHYLNYRENYALVATQKAVDYNSDIYGFYDTPVFKEATNDIIISSDINGVQVNPVQFSQYENFITSENIFSEFNQNVYGAVFGIFSSDGGDSINATDYTVTLYPEVFLSEDAVLGLRFTVDATDAAVSLIINGQSITSTDIASERVLFVPISSASSDVSVTFEQESGVDISEIQSFLHTESIDTCYVAEFNSLSSLSFIDSEKVEIVYGVEKKSTRIKIIKTLALNEPDDGKIVDFTQALILSTSLSIFQSVLRDYQYGSNNSGRNLNFVKDLFVDSSQSDEAFRHFLVYATTASLSSSFDAVYPLTPETASNDLISDYTLSETEISRFKQLAVRLTSRPAPALGILLE
jgi:uncharacterized phage protein gp47/JayE